MTDTVTQPAQEDAEAQALAAARAGYASRAGKRAAQAAAPAEAAVQQPAEQPLADPAPAPEPEPTPEPAPESNLSAEPAPAPIDPTPAFVGHLEDLKAQVRELKENGVDAKTVHTLAGVVGDINRQIKELAAAKKEDAPAAESKLAAAIKRAKEKAAEYPDIGLPMVEALEELAAGMTGKDKQEPAPEPTPAPTPAPTAAPVAASQVDLDAERQAAADNAARKAVLEIHPDYAAVRHSEEFKKWFAARPAEYQKKALSSWNPVVVAEPVTAFKAHIAAQREAARKRQERLDAAAQPQGIPQSGGPTQLPDEEGFRRGYARAARRRL